MLLWDAKPVGEAGLNNSSFRCLDLWKNKFPTQKVFLMTVLHINEVERGDTAASAKRSLFFYTLEVLPPSYGMKSPVVERAYRLLHSPDTFPIDPLPRGNTPDVAGSTDAKHRHRTGGFSE